MENVKSTLKIKRDYEDLSGKTFNMLTVIDRGDDYIHKTGSRIIRYNCVCACGNKCLVRSHNLKSGKTKSCGCFRGVVKKSKHHKGLDDLSGRTFNRWRVIRRSDDYIEPSGRKVTMWQCVCECGFIKDVRSGSLKSGSSKSCGCLKRDKLLVDYDIKGQRFGRWCVLEKSAPVYNETIGRNVYQWLCMCECGTKRHVSEQSLVQNKSLSCGCFRNERLREVATYEDLSGRQFGYWTVLNRVDDRFYKGGGRSQMWRCRCVCGSENDVAGQMLKPGISQSCGCIGGSYLELYTQQVLSELYIEYSREVSFDGLVGVAGGLLSYDFAVYSDEHRIDLVALIECQGEQHYRPVEYFGGVSRFEVQQIHDLRKKEYAECNSVPLVYIPYTCRTYDDIFKLLNEQILSII